MKEGYEPDVVNDDIDSSSTDEDFDVERESRQTRNDDSDDEYVYGSYTASEDSESRRYRTRNSVDKRKKPEPAAKPSTAKEEENRKERNSSSDEEGDVRQVKSFMASNTMPLNDDPDDEHSKSTRKFFGKDEAVYIMDAKKAGNIGRYFNVSLTVNCEKKSIYLKFNGGVFYFAAFVWTESIRAKCVRRYTRLAIPMGSVLCINTHQSRYRTHLEL